MQKSVVCALKKKTNKGMVVPFTSAKKLLLL